LIEVCSILIFCILIITTLILLLVFKPYSFFSINEKYLYSIKTVKIKYTFDKMKMLDFMRNYPKCEIHFRNYKNKQEYFETLKEYIIAQDKEKVVQIYKDILFDEVLKNSNILKLPKLCVLYEKRKLVKEFKQTTLQANVNNTMSLDIFKMNSEETAKDKAKKKLILKALSKQLNVKVTNKDKKKFSTFSHFEILEHNVKLALCRKYLEIY